MIGRTLSHHKILSEISRGGMGIVYRAVDLKLESWPIPYVRKFYFLDKIHEGRSEMDEALEYYRRRRKRRSQ